MDAKDTSHKFKYPEFYVMLPHKHSKASELGSGGGGYFTHVVCRDGFNSWDWTHRHSFPRWKNRKTAEKHLKTAHNAGFVDAYIVDNSCD